MRSRFPRAIVAAVLGLLLAAAFASAAGTAAASTVATSTPAASTVATSTPGVSTAPRPKGKLRLFLPNQYVVQNQIVTIAGRGVQVDGVVNPWVAGQSVTVKATLGGRVISTKRVAVKPSRNHTYGVFSLSVSSSGTGTVTIEVTHKATSELGGLSARRSFAALDTNIGFGSTGRMVELVQQRLAALHFYIPQTGVYDQGTGLAVDAYHRLLGWGVSQNADHATITWLMNGWGAFQVHDPRDGTHAEGNLTRQLLALIKGSQVQYIFPISSGKPSTPTVLGHFSVYRRVPGYLPDGMYFSSFFYTGYAIHGYDPAPDYPASHGCMRLPIVDAIFVFNWLNFGDSVDVYN